MSAMATKNYYTILGVLPTESARGIREAFRELAKRYHPDRVGPQGTRLFQDIVEAYQVLSDPERRQYYTQSLRHAEGRADMQPE
jgi:molecular chaperone DnaJ